MCLVASFCPEEAQSLVQEVRLMFTMKKIPGGLLCARHFAQVILILTAVVEGDYHYFGLIDEEPGFQLAPHQASL